MAEEFYLKANENAPETGPFSSKKMRQLASTGQITPETLVRRGDSSWVHATSVRGLEIANGSAPLSPAPAADVVPMGIPVVPTEDHGISLSPRITDPTGSTGEAQVQLPADEPHAFDDDTPTPPSITAPPPPPPVLPAAPLAAPVIETKEKPAASEISEMIAVTPTDKAEGKGKKKKAKHRPARTSTGEPRSGGGIGGLFSFNTMIAPTVAKIVYYLCLALIILGWLGGSVAVLLVGLIAGDPVGAIGGAIGFIFLGGVIALIYILGLRISAEVVIAFFRAADDLAAIRAHNEEKP